jgi:exosome complex exonuclease DIS3/RRP44
MLASFYRLTRRGVSKIVREHYLRDDLPCGVQDCALCGGDAPGGGSHAAAAWAGGGDEDAAAA